MNKWLAEGEAELAEWYSSQERANSAKRADRAAIGTIGTIGTEKREEDTSSSRLPDTACAVHANSAGRAVPEWAEGVAKLISMRCPESVPAATWRALVDDSAKFLESAWAETAAALGWSLSDLWRCHRGAPVARGDCAGMIWAVRGGHIVALTAWQARIKWPRGAIVTEPKRVPPAYESGALCLAWELL